MPCQCKTKPSTFRGGISTQPISGNLSKNGQNPLVSLTVQSSKRRVASCAANGLAHAVVDRISGFPNVKTALFRAQITADERAINSLKAGIASPSVATTDKLLLQTQLSARQTDLSSASQLLVQATQVETPKVLTPASAQLVTARSRRNSVVIGGADRLCCSACSRRSCGTGFGARASRGAARTRSVGSRRCSRRSRWRSSCPRTTRRR